MKDIAELKATYGHEIEQAAFKHGLEPSILAGLIWVESKGNPQAVSHCGAKGLCQFMPATAIDVGLKNPFDPKESIYAGAMYLAKIRDRWAHGSIILALAGYNAGPGRIKGNRWKRFKETVAYVPNILRWAAQYRRLS